GRDSWMEVSVRGVEKCVISTYLVLASILYFFFFFKQKTAYEIGLGIPAEPLFRSKNVITSCSVTMMLFLHLEVKPLMTLTTVLYLSCALISGHLAMMLMELTKRR